MSTGPSSPDGYVLIPIPDLIEVQLSHLMSDRDPTIAVSDGSVQPVLTGYTEWTGEWRRAAVTVGWDWGVVEDAIVLLNPAEIRTNVRLLDPDRRPVPAAPTAVHLARWIDSFPWQQTIVSEVLHQA